MKNNILVLIVFVTCRVNNIQGNKFNTTIINETEVYLEWSPLPDGYQLKENETISYKFQYYALSTYSGCLARNISVPYKLIHKEGNIARLNIPNLIPYTIYKFDVLWKTNDPLKSKNDYVKLLSGDWGMPPLKELENNSLPFILKVQEVAGRILNVFIHSSNCSAIKSSLVIYVSAKCNDVWCSREISNRSLIYKNQNNIINYQQILPYTHYEITSRVCIENTKICSESNETIFIFTKPTIPNRFEMDIYSLNESFFDIRWKRPYPPTGILDSFKISCLLININNNRDRKTFIQILPSNSTPRCELWPDYYCFRYVNRALDKFKYQLTISIMAANRVPGEYNIPFSITRMMTKVEPDPVTNLTAIWNNSLLDLSWTHPFKTMGELISFDIFIEDKSKRGLEEFMRERMFMNESLYNKTYYYKVKNVFPPSITLHITVNSFNSFLSKDTILEETTPPPIPFSQNSPEIRPSTHSIQIEILPNIDTSTVTESTIYLLLIDESFQENINDLSTWINIENASIKQSNKLIEKWVVSDNATIKYTIGVDSSRYNNISLIPNSKYIIITVLVNMFNNKFNYNFYITALITKNQIENHHLKTIDGNVEIITLNSTSVILQLKRQINESLSFTFTYKVNKIFRDNNAYNFHFQHSTIRNCSYVEYLDANIKQSLQGSIKVNKMPYLISKLLPYSSYDFYINASPDNLNTVFYHKKQFHTDFIDTILQQESVLINRIEEIYNPNALEYYNSSNSTVLSTSIKIILSSINCTLIRGPIDIFIVAQCQQSWCKSSITSNFLYNLETNFVILNNLQPNNIYEVKIVSCRHNVVNSSCIKGNVKYIKTKSTVPNLINDFNVYTRNTTSFSLRWKEPFPPTGIIDKYLIQYSCVGCEGIYTNNKEPGRTFKLSANDVRCVLWPEENCFTVTMFTKKEASLIEESKYRDIRINVTIQSTNRRPSKVYSNPYSLYFNLEKKYPGPPQNLSIKWDKNNGLEINWRHPYFINWDLIYYEINIKEIKIDSIKEVLRATIDPNKGINNITYSYRVKQVLNPSSNFDIIMTSYNGFYSDEVYIADSSPPPIPQFVIPPKIDFTQKKLEIELDTFNHLLVNDFYITMFVSKNHYSDLDNIEYSENRIVQKRKTNDFIFLGKWNMYSIINNYFTIGLDKLLEKLDNDQRMSYPNLVIFVTNEFLDKKSDYRTQILLDRKYTSEMSYTSAILIACSIILIIIIVMIVICSCKRTRKIIVSKNSNKPQSRSNSIDAIFKKGINSSVDDSVGHSDDEATNSLDTF